MKKYLNQQDMKSINLSNVLRLIRNAGPITRRGIEAAMDLSWGAVSNATAQLLRDGYIVEVKADETAGAGRTPIALAVNGEDHFLLGLDVNRSGLSGVVMNLKNEVLHTVACEPTGSNSRDEWITQITELIHRLLALIPHKSVLAIGIAMQGAVDTASGIAASFPAQDWENVPLAELLSEQFDLPVYLEHDPDCILYAASTQAELLDSILIRVDKGIGMAVMIEGEIFKRYGALEIGDTVLAADGTRLSHVTTEAGLSARAGLPFEELVRKAEAGEQSAAALFDEMAEQLGASIANMACLFHIHDFLLCGKMLKHKHLFFAHTVAAAQRHANGRLLHMDVTQVEKAAVGAALLAAERVTLQFN